MARQRFSAPLIDLPNVPQELDSFRRAIINQFTLQATPGLFRVHEIDLIDPPRGGVNKGAYLPVGATYADKDGFVKMVLPTEQWVMNKEMKLTGGAITTS